MDKLVTRDFFPHYDNLKDQNDYLEAEEDGDTEKMREIAVKYRKRTGERPTTGAWTVGGTPLMTPADFDGNSPNREKKVSPKFLSLQINLIDLQSIIVISTSASSSHPYIYWY